MIQDSLATNCQFMDKLSTYLSGFGQTQVSSDAVSLTFCQNHCIDSRSTEKILTVYPGTRFNVSFAAIGLFDGMTRASVRLHYAEVFLYEQKDLSDFAQLYVYGSDSRHTPKMDEHEWECYLDHFRLYRSTPDTDSHHNNGECFTLSRRIYVLRRNACLRGEY